MKLTAVAFGDSDNLRVGIGLLQSAIRLVLVARSPLVLCLRADATSAMGHTMISSRQMRRSIEVTRVVPCLILMGGDWNNTAIYSQSGGSVGIGFAISLTWQIV